MGESLVLRVSGIPTSLYYKMVRDKLLIHFLRRSNGGGGEVDVRYPTEEEGVAVLTFNQEKVASRVLSRGHQLEMEGYSYPLDVSRPQCRGTQVSKPLMALSLDEDEGSDSDGRPGYRSDGSSQPKNTSTEDSSSSSDKHHVSGEEAGKQSPMKSLPDKSSNKTSNRDPSPRRTKRTPEPLPTDHDGHSSTGDGSRTPHIIQYLGSVGSNQRRPNETSSDDPTFIKKHPRSNIAASLNLYPVPHKRLPAYEDRKIGRSSPLPSNVKPADGSGLDGGTFASTQFRENLPESRHLKENFAAESSSSQRKPKGTIADGFTSNQKYPNSTIGDGSDFNPGQPKNTSTDELNPKHSKSTIVDGTKFNSGEPKNASREEFNSSQNHSKSANRDGTKFSSRQPKNISTDEFNSNLKHSNSTVDGTTKSTSGQPKNTSTDELNPKHSKSTIVDDTKIHYGQPKNTSREELNLSQNHSNSTIEGTTKPTSGQAKNSSTDKVNSNSKPSKSAVGDSTTFSSGEPKNTSIDELNLNPKLPKNALGDGANFKPGNPQNSTPDEFYLHPRDPEDQTARSSSHSSLMAAGWSSSSSPTSLTTNNPKNRLDESSLSTELFVDPAAHTYISVFMKDIIDDTLGQSNAEIKIETGDGYIRLILTTKSPHLSQNFYKAAREMSDIFTKCQRFLRSQSIDLSYISSDVTKKLQKYLFYCGIWSSPNGKRLQMIGPSKDITRFMEKWTSAGGDFAKFVHLLQEVSPASSRPPVVGRDNVHQSTTGNHNVTHDVHTRRARSRDRREETGVRGGGRRPDSISCSKTPSDKPWK